MVTQNPFDRKEQGYVQCPQIGDPKAAVYSKTATFLDRSRRGGPHSGIYSDLARRSLSLSRPARRGASSKSVRRQSCHTLKSNPWKPRATIPSACRRTRPLEHIAHQFQRAVGQPGATCGGSMAASATKEDRDWPAGQAGDDERDQGTSSFGFYSSAMLLAPTCCRHL